MIHLLFNNACWCIYFIERKKNALFNTINIINKFFRISLCQIFTNFTFAYLLSFTLNVKRRDFNKKTSIKKWIELCHYVLYISLFHINKCFEKKILGKTSFYFRIFFYFIFIRTVFVLLTAASYFDNKQRNLLSVH